MTCAIEPGRTYEIVLPDHAAAPEPLTFVAKAASARQAIRIISAIKRVTEGDLLEGTTELVGAIQPVLVGWKNARNEAGEEVPFAVDAVLDLLTLREVARLAGSLIGRLEADERKKSE